MGKELVLISHGRFCEELKKSTEMIMGPQESIHTVALLPEESPEDFRDKFLEAVKELDDYLVFADLLGGTPCNAVSRLIMEGQLDVALYAGMNMPMVISYLNNALLGVEGNYTEKATEYIVDVSQTLRDMMSDDENEKKKTKK